MLTAQVETFAENFGALKATFERHADELDTYRDRRPLDPDYGEYLRREAAGELLFVTLRKDGQVVGYFIGVVRGALHYTSTLTCLQDIFFTFPEHRTGRPVGPIKLFRCVIAECRRRGVKELRLGSKTAHDASRLFEYFGAVEVERIHSLWLGD